MPLIQIRRRHDALGGETLVPLRDNLLAVAAEALMCAEGGQLAPKDIMIEIDDLGPYDINNKDINIRVWAHDYPTRKTELDSIRKRITEEVLKHLPAGLSWYVWVLLVPTSYGSDTEEG